MGVKISGIATQQSTPGNDDRFEISRLVSTGPDVWETDYIEWSDFITNLNSNLDFIPLSGTGASLLTGTIEFDGTTIETALATVDFDMYLGSGDTTDLAGTATRYGNIYFGSDASSSYTGIQAWHSSKLASIDLLSDATDSTIDFTTNGTLSAKISTNGDFNLLNDDQSLVFYGGSKFKKVSGQDIDFIPAVGGTKLRFRNDADNYTILGINNNTKAVGIGYYLNGDEAFAIKSLGLGFLFKGFSAGGSLLASIDDSGYYSSDNATASRVAYWDSSKKLKSSSITDTELGYLSGATSNIQNQINNLMIGVGGWKSAARVLVSSNVTISSPGASLDGIAMSSGDRVVLNGQSTGSQNGVYVWNGAASAMTRATDCSTGDSSNTGILGMVITIEEGTYADQMWMLTNNGPITIGATSLSYSKTSATTYTGSTGVTLVGNDFRIDNTWFSGDVTVGATGITAIGAGKVTNTMIASMTSANLATIISDETGSGALVFASAPTLINPVVGTQSAGDNSTKAASTAFVDTAVNGVTSVWRKIQLGNITLFAASVTAADVYWATFQSNATIRQNVAATPTPSFIYLKSSDYPNIEGKTAKLRIYVSQCSVNDVGPGRTITVGLYPCSGPTSGTTGGAGNRAYASGTVVTGSNTISFASPAADSMTFDQATASFSFPADGLYAIAADVAGGAFSANSGVWINAELQVHYE